MPALVESMFYTGNEVPWHGLGTQVATAPTSKDALTLAGLDWRVDSQPIRDMNKNVIPGYKANVRTSDHSVLGIVSDKYKIVQNEDAFAFVDSLVQDGSMTYETAGSLKNGRTVWLLAKMPKTQILNDDIEPYICFTNTHDGSGAVRVCMTPIRVVCANTLNFALSSARRSWATRHMGDIYSKLSEAKETLGLAQSYMTALSDEADILANKKLTSAELEGIFDSLYPIDRINDSARKISNIENMKDELFKRYDAPDIKQYKDTAWGAANAIADFADHSAPSRNTSKFEENRWYKVMYGHPFVDSMYYRIAA